MCGNEQESYAQHRAANETRQKRTQRIAELNDQARAGAAEHLLTITPGVRALGPFAAVAIVRALRSFTDFSEDNDPHGERDFGALEHAGETIFWKMDYYDKALEFGSPDPSDPAVTQRVITIMLASEY